MRLTVSLIALVVLASTIAFAQDKDSPEPKAADEGWIQLFNGKDLTGWTPKIKGHALGEDPYKTVRVEDGVMRVGYDGYTPPFNSRFCHIFYEKPFSKYHLRVEYRFHGDQVAGGPGWAWRNSGAMLHCQDPKTMRVDQPFPVCVEGQLLGGDGTSERTNGNLCTPGTNVVMKDNLVQRHCINSTSKTCHGDDWVVAEFIVDGSGTIKHIIDGELVLEFEQSQYDPRDPDAKKLMGDGGLLIDSGWISLQGESHPVDFKRVEIKPLK